MNDSDNAKSVAIPVESVCLCGDARTLLTEDMHAPKVCASCGTSRSPQAKKESR